MSRSYKHTPYSGERDKFYKKYANRRLRRKKLDHDLQHGSYRKDSCSWDICDYSWIETTNFENYYRRQVEHWLYLQSHGWTKRKSFPTRKEVWNEYQKLYKRK